MRDCPLRAQGVACVRIAKGRVGGICSGCYEGGALNGASGWNKKESTLHTGPTFAFTMMIHEYLNIWGPVLHASLPFPPFMAVMKAADCLLSESMCMLRQWCC